MEVEDTGFLLRYRGRPIVSLFLALLFGGLAYIGLAASGEVVFDWLLAISGLSQFFTWASICLCHIRFRSGTDFAFFDFLNFLDSHCYNLNFPYRSMESART